MYGLKEKHIKAINSVFLKYPQIEKAILYGSRAKGNYRNGSDIDLTLVGDDLDLNTLFKIETELDDLLLPYKVDLSILHKIENQDLVDHINRVGITFYEKVESEWKEDVLENVALLEKESWKVGDENLPYIALEHIVEGGLRLQGIGDSNTIASNKYRFNSDCFLFGKLRPYFRKLYRPSFEGICSTDIWVVKPKGENDKDFLFYFFANQEFVDFTYSGSSGTRMPRADWKFVGKSKWYFPEPTEQKYIAEVLTSLDDKIDLLHRQNKTLEAMAETLYESWVFEKDFDSTIKDLIDIQNGYAFKSKSFQDNGTHRVLKIKNISGGIVNIQTTDFVSDETVLKIDKKFKIKTGDILFAMTGAKIGKMGIIPQTEYSLWLNQRVGLFKEKVKGSRFLAYLHLKSDYGFDYIENTATGSAQPNISGTGIENCEFPKFIEKEIKEFSKQLELLYEKVFFNLGQVRKLEQIRDTLLPKLMSGEIKVVENE